MHLNPKDWQIIAYRSGKPSMRIAFFQSFSFCLSPMMQNCFGVTISPLNLIQARWIAGQKNFFKRRRPVSPPQVTGTSSAFLYFSIANSIENAGSMLLCNLNNKISIANFSIGANNQTVYVLHEHKSAEKCISMYEN